MGFFELKCGFSCNKQPIFHLVRVSRESGILGLKDENPCFENFSGVLSSRFHLGEVKSHKDFRRWKTKNMKMGFWPCLLQIPSFLELSSIFHSDEWKSRYSILKISGWKLKGHSRLTQKSQNGPFLISSSFLLKPIETDEIKFGWV